MTVSIVKDTNSYHSTNVRVLQSLDTHTPPQKIIELDADVRYYQIKSCIMDTKNVRIISYINFDHNYCRTKIPSVLNNITLTLFQSCINNLTKDPQ